MDTSQQDPLGEDPRTDVWAGWPGAVLLSDEIEFYCRNDPPLISPFDPANLKPARYQLTLGNEARVGGKTCRIDEDNPLVIPAHQVAIVRTYETLNIPRFLIGRWNLRVDMVYKGLLWVGALQVDPGWIGYLPCPLYNLSDQDVRIKYREKYVSMDFVRTTKLHEKSKLYARPPYNPPIASYDPNALRSGPYESLKDLEGLTQFRDFAFGLISVFIAVFAAVIAALAIIVIRPTVTSGSSMLSFWPMTALVGAGFAVVLSAFSLGVAFWKIPRRRRK